MDKKERMRTLVACDVCRRGYPYGEMVLYTNGSKVCRECSEMNIDIRANGKLTDSDRVEILRFAKEIKEKSKSKLTTK